MSEFDKVKDDAERYAQEHPEQVHKAEDAAEKKIGLGGEQAQGGEQGQYGQGSQPDESGQGGEPDQ